MKLWLPSAIALGVISGAMAASNSEALDPRVVVRQWASHATTLAARGLEDLSLSLNATTMLRRDRFASVEMMADFPSSHPFRTLSASIGMLLIDMQTPEGKRKTYICTAALIRRDLVITNEHCLKQDGYTVIQVMLWLAHTHSDDGSVIGLDLAPIDSDATLDYALLRPLHLHQAVRFPDLGSHTFRVAVPGERLFIIHHSKGKAQQVSRAFCRAGSEPTRRNEISYSCPTQSGSSGALVFAESDGAIVGLHHSSTRRADMVKGYAASIAAILAKSEALALRTAAR